MPFNKKKLLQFVLVNDVVWAIAKPFVYIVRRLEASRNDFINRKTEEQNTLLCKNIFSERKVLHGPFEGLLYGDVEATGSSIYPKLLGTYEAELHEHLDRLLKKEYDSLVNIGCDEGYYAVGMASIKPELNVIAFDCNRKARQKTGKLAQLNNVAERIAMKGCFDQNDLTAETGQHKMLFIIDCEGCENDIITAALIMEYSQADFIIELHYDIHPLILEKLTGLFVNTHDISVVKALSDHERVINNKNVELSGLTFAQKHFILNERNGFMEWLVAEAK